LALIALNVACVSNWQSKMENQFWPIFECPGKTLAGGITTAVRISSGNGSPRRRGLTGRIQAVQRRREKLLRSPPARKFVSRRAYRLTLKTMPSPWSPPPAVVPYIA
jgi:hypothetical protein